MFFAAIIKRTAGLYKLIAPVLIMQYYINHAICIAIVFILVDNMFLARSFGLHKEKYKSLSSQCTKTIC